jgi:hypothetical protein
MSLPSYAIAGDPTNAPFLIEVGMTEAKVVLGQALAASGLLAHLPLELLPVLLALLAQVGPLGDVQASPQDVAQMLGIHPDEAEARLSRLAVFPSPEYPLAYCQGDRYRLSKQYIVPIAQSLSFPPSEQETYRPVPREEVIARSREQYATPREEAERQVEMQLGIEPLPEGPEGEVLQALVNVGVPQSVGHELIASFPLARIQAQLHWLPKRGARNPARYLVSAVQGDFGPPGSSLPVQATPLTMNTEHE